MKFKVGDKVKLNRSSLNGHFKAGETVIIDYIDGKGGWQNKVIVGDYRFDWIADDWAEVNNKPSLPINITFKNKYEHQAVQQFLFDNGCKWGDGGGVNVFTYGHGDITVRDDKDIFLGCSGMDKFKNAPTFTINDLETIKEILNPSKPIVTFELNDSYKAEIDPNTETVKVGCQSFTFAKIKELVNKIEGK